MHILIAHKIRNYIKGAFALIIIFLWREVKILTMDNLIGGIDFIKYNIVVHACEAYLTYKHEHGRVQAYLFFTAI